MKTSSPSLIERVAEMAGNDLLQLHQFASKVIGRIVEHSGKRVKRARYRLRNGATLATEIEEKVAAEFRSRPANYLWAAVAFSCLVALKIVLNGRKKAGKKND